MEVMKNNIVIIDNNLANLDLLENTISQVDTGRVFHCTSFVYSDEAIRILTAEFNHVPRYIFINANMPRLSGTECLKILRTRETFDDCLIIIFSAVMPEPVADAFRRLGADFVFQKPLNVNDCKQMIIDVLSKRTEALLV
jgi:CheY-like chemotaxis protein